MTVARSTVYDSLIKMYTGQANEIHLHCRLAGKSIIIIYRNKFGNCIIIQGYFGLTVHNYSKQSFLVNFIFVFSLYHCISLYIFSVNSVHSNTELKLKLRLD